MIPVKVICPYCNHEKTLQFDENEYNDETFVECAKEQPWVVPCDSCFKEFGHHEKAFLEDLYQQENSGVLL